MLCGCVEQQLPTNLCSGKLQTRGKFPVPRAGSSFSAPQGQRDTQMLLNSGSTSDNECTVVRKKNPFGLCCWSVKFQHDKILCWCQGRVWDKMGKFPRFETCRKFHKFQPTLLGVQDAVWEKGGFSFQVSPAWIRETFLQIDVFLKGFKLWDFQKIPQFPAQFVGGAGCTLGRFSFQVSPAWIRETFLQFDVFLKGFFSFPWFAHEVWHEQDKKPFHLSPSQAVLVW